MPRRNTWEISDSGISTAVNTSGAVRSATAYQPAPTRHLLILMKRLRKPALPWTRPVNKIPDTLGPTSTASIAPRGIVVNCSLVAGIPPGPTARTKPTHVIANVRAK